MVAETFVTEVFAMHAAALVLAMCGGAVRFFQVKSEKTLPQLFVSVLSSGFAGELVSCFTSTLDIAIGIRIGIIGLAGYAAAEILPLMSKILQAKISGTSIQVSEEEKKSEVK